MNHLNIYVISNRDYRIAKEKLVGKSCYNCMNGTCRVQSMNHESMSSCLGWENRDLSMKAVFLNNYDIDALQNISDLDGQVLTDDEYKLKRLELLRKNAKVQRLI